MRCGVYVKVSTDDQRDNGYSIDSQLRMIKEYCEKNEYDIVDVYNDAGHSGKDLMRPEMQRLLKDIKSKKIDKLVAININIDKYINSLSKFYNISPITIEKDKLNLDELENNNNLLQIISNKKNHKFDKDKYTLLLIND